MGMRKKDLYQTWKDTGEFDGVMAFIRDCAKKLVSQREMCEYLGIDEATFTRMKKKHPDIAKMQGLAKLDLKKELADAMYKKAVGYETVDEEQYIEDRGKGKEQKRKIHRTKRQVGPDYRAIVYLLTKHFGREFGERYDELMMAAERADSGKEEWSNGGSEEEAHDSDEEDK